MRPKRLKTIVYLGVAFLLTSIPVLGQKASVSNGKELAAKWERADSKFLEGRAYFAKKKYDRAEAEFKNCLEILPEHADALFFLSQIDYLRGDFGRALANIREAETSHAIIAGASIVINSRQRARLLEERKKKEQEIAAMEEILYSGSCKTDDEMLKLPESIEALRREISAINARLKLPAQNGPPPIPADYSFIHGNILYKLERTGEAVDQYLKAIESDARHAGAYNNLISIFFIARDYGNALKWIEQAEAKGVSLNPKLKQAIIPLAKK